MQVSVEEKGENQDETDESRGVKRKAEDGEGEQLEKTTEGVLTIIIMLVFSVVTILIG